MRILCLSLVLLAFSTACASISGVVPAPLPLPASGKVWAGAAKVDITPLPGVPMGGHSIAGTVARGYWTRLFARAIYLEDRDGHSLVLVSCDLWAMPAGLADRVAELVATTMGVPHLGRAQIVLAATHTHQSPGNYASARLYNDYAQRWAGFDQPLFEFLAYRIAMAVQAAFQARHEATITWGETVVPGLAENRSFEAFLLNPEAPTILQENARLPGTHDAARAVDPRLTLLRITTASHTAELMAIAAFVAVHPTAMSHATEVYSSDLFGVAATVAEQALRAASPQTTPVVAIFNGAEGDIHPAWQQQDRRNTVRLGRLLATKILQAGPDALPVDLAITSHFSVVPLAGGCFTAPSSTVAHTSVERCAAPTPLPGVAMLGGAEDGRTVFYTLGWREGVKTAGPRQPDQGVKQPAFDPTFLPYRWPFSITQLVTATTSLPQAVPIGVYRLGQQLVLATLPGEFTMVMGRRMAQALQQTMRPAPERVLLVGLANEYVSYFATPEEYEAQHYEGASTLYGPYSGPLVGEALRQLALLPPGSGTAHAFHYRPGPRKHFGVRDLGASPEWPDDGLASVAQDLDTGLPVRDFPRFCWQDTEPALPWPYDPGVLVTPQVAIECLQEAMWSPCSFDGNTETDEGLNFITVALAAREQSSQWCTLWMPPSPRERASALRFRIVTLRGTPICSEVFRLQEHAGVLSQRGCSPE